MRAAGCLVTDAEVTILAKRVDPYNTKYCELNDYLNCIFQVSQKDDSQLAIQNAFAAFDKDDSGVVTVTELKHVLSKFGEPLKENEVKTLDLDGGVLVELHNKRERHDTHEGDHQGARLHS